MSQRSNTPQRRKPLVKKNRSFPLLKNIPAYRGQVVEDFHISLAPIVVTTTVATGQIANVYAVTAAAIPTFATRFASLFEEYRIVKVRFVVKNFSTINPGLFTHWFDEKNATAPTAAEALRINLKTFSACSPSPHSLTWVARDPLDLQYTDCSSLLTNPVSYKLYTDNAVFGSSIVATAYAQVTASILIQFRGLA
jgi:hypothetical protein